MLENDQNNKDDNQANIIETESSETKKKKSIFSEAIKNEDRAKRFDLLAYNFLFDLLICIALSDFIRVLIDNIEYFYIVVIVCIVMMLPLFMASFIWIAYRKFPRKLEQQTLFNRLFSKPVLWALFIAIILIVSKIAVNYLFLEQFTAYIIQ